MFTGLHDIQEDAPVCELMASRLNGKLKDSFLKQERGGLNSKVQYMMHNPLVNGLLNLEESLPSAARPLYSQGENALGDRNIIILI